MNWRRAMRRSRESSRAFDGVWAGGELVVSEHEGGAYTREGRTLTDDVDDDASPVPAGALCASAAVEGVDAGVDEVDERPGEDDEAEGPRSPGRGEELDLGQNTHYERQHCTWGRGSAAGWKTTEGWGGGVR